MFRLANISDAHPSPLPDVTYRERTSKRVVGYVKWQRDRRRHMHDGVIHATVADLRSLGTGGRSQRASPWKFISRKRDICANTSFARARYQRPLGYPNG